MTSSHTSESSGVEEGGDPMEVGEIREDESNASTPRPSEEDHASGGSNVERWLSFHPNNFNNSFDVMLVIEVALYPHDTYCATTQATLTTHMYSSKQSNIDERIMGDNIPAGHVSRSTTSPL
ncbi:hypothetical protein AGABI1DRAFT_96242 [Agaricus bisporus var. burnettii JB137-S8]|uniref:Uncharacterized protein n=1 Tax=Agaricus bisporus var. burnettii (strain JB137-S8 / ATCC MYA-4627 / FGSC 10392) TaxID=597362 RepID=K5VGR3_AGABU|nr:uncharacterized protein AGABI1DRAFT_96242 [Agaricus bisporus var. burnettii JB137-S8]EKM73524.1 hypothetical protein AGABI1DRAFT_96242 [Agaricus bisporus var. burnettii JB137-S8]